METLSDDLVTKPPAGDSGIRCEEAEWDSIQDCTGEASATKAKGVDGDEVTCFVEA